MTRYHRRFVVRFFASLLAVLILMSAITVVCWFFSFHPSRHGSDTVLIPQRESEAVADHGLDAASRIEFLNGRIALEPRSPALLADRAVVHLRENRYSAAIADARAALAINGEHATALLVLGSAEVLSGDLERGMNWLEEARRAGADARRVDLVRAGAFRHTGRFTDADGIVTNLIAANPFDDAALILRAELCLLEGRPAEALHALEGEFWPRDSVRPAHVLRGITLIWLSRWAEALESFRVARSLGPGDPVPQLGAGVALRELGEIAEAEVVYEQALSSIPSDLGAELAGAKQPDALAVALLKIANRHEIRPGGPEN